MTTLLDRHAHAQIQSQIQKEDTLVPVSIQSKGVCSYIYIYTSFQLRYFSVKMCIVNFLSNSIKKYYCEYTYSLPFTPPTYIYIYIYIYIYMQGLLNRFPAFFRISSSCNALVVPLQQLLEGFMEVLLCERVSDLPRSLFHLLNCLITTACELRE